MTRPASAAGQGRTGQAARRAAWQAAAVRSLRERGLRILDRNWRCPLGQLDIVACDGATLVAVTVVASPGRRQPPRTASQPRLRQLAVASAATRGLRFAAIRVEVIAVSQDAGRQVAVVASR